MIPKINPNSILGFTNYNGWLLPIKVGMHPTLEYPLKGSE